MIPYFQIPPLRLGPLTIQPFGVLTALGILLAAQLLVREARRKRLDPGPVADFPFWGVLGGVACAHFVHLFFYHPEELAAGGVLQIFKIWDGLSSTGGMIGGAFAAAIFFRSRGARFSDYADVFALSVAPGWAVARLGCFSVHDHPGVLTHFALAVGFPGGARHDLGLDDAILLFAITGLVWVLDRRRLLVGKLLPLLALLYGLGRFALDFLRARDLPYVDARHGGLTFAQYACIVLVAYGVRALLSGPAVPASSSARPT